MDDYISRFEEAIIILEEEAKSFSQFTFALHMLMERLVASDTISVFSFVTHSNISVNINAVFKGEVMFDRLFYYKPED